MCMLMDQLVRDIMDTHMNTATTMLMVRVTAMISSKVVVLAVFNKWCRQVLCLIPFHPTV